MVAACWRDTLFPGRARLWIGTGGGQDLRRKLYYRYGEQLFGIPDRSSESIDLNATEREAALELRRDIALRQALFLFPDGHEWEIRGFDYRCAANGSQATNIPGYAIQIMLPNTWSVPPQSQIEGVRQLVAKIRATAAAADRSTWSRASPWRG